MKPVVDSSTGFFEELHRRAGGGLEVTLLWRRGASKLIVSVADTMTGESFELPVSRKEARLLHEAIQGCLHALVYRE